MNPDKLLAQLRDIHSPAPVDWWPPAPGWWIVGILVLLLLVFTITMIVKRYRSLAWKRQALAEYANLQQQYLAQPDQEPLLKIVQLMKRIVQHLNPDSNATTRVSRDWSDLLKQHRHNLPDKDIATLTTDLYQRDIPVLDRPALDRIQQWIKECH